MPERERFTYAYGFFANPESWRHDLQVCMAELTTILRDAPPDSTVRGVLGEAMEELPELLYWSRIDCLDRAAVNRALAGHPTKGAQL